MILLRKTLILFMLSCCVMPSTALAIDLLQAYEDARAHDPVVLAAKARLQERGELIPQAYALLLPNAGLNGTANKGAAARHRLCRHTASTRTQFDAINDTIAD